MLFTNSGEIKFKGRELTEYESIVFGLIIMTLRQKFKAIREAVYDTQLSMSERKLYKWIVTQEKHKHLHSKIINGNGYTWVERYKPMFYIKRK